MSKHLTPEEALDLARRFWPWAKYIACDANWVTKVYGERPEYHYPHWTIRGVLEASVGTNVIWTQIKIDERIVEVLS